MYLSQVYLTNIYLLIIISTAVELIPSPPYSPPPPPAPVDMTSEEEVEQTNANYVEQLPENVEAENKSEKKVLREILESVGLPELLETFKAEETVKTSTALELKQELNIPSSFAKKTKNELDRRLTVATMATLTLTMNSSDTVVSASWESMGPSEEDNRRYQSTGFLCPVCENVF